MHDYNEWMDQLKLALNTIASALIIDLEDRGRRREDDAEPNYVLYLDVQDSSKGPSSTTNPKPTGNHPTACSGKPIVCQPSKRQPEPHLIIGCLALRTRDGGSHTHTHLHV